MYDGVGWSSWPDMQVARTNHRCGMVIKANGTREVLVTGGLHSSTTEVFNLDTQKWR